MKKLLGAIALFSSVFGLAQNTICGTDIVHEHAMQNAEEYRDGIHGWEQLFTNSELPQSTNNEGNTLYTIPVVVHVFHNDGDENISKAQVLDAIRVLNDDFNRTNSDTANTRSIFKPIAADVQVQFELAKIDPNGNCTDGIVRVRTPKTEGADDDIKLLSSWDNDKYLNIYVVRSINNFGNAGTILGYAYYPSYNQYFQQDGVMMRHDVMGSIGTSATSGFNNGGRTLTHEVGHYLGLPHTFDGGCGGGDNIADTPPAAGPNYGCPLTANTCSNDSPNLPDQIENYMDYSNGFCQNMFSNGQKAVMHGSLQDFGLRGQLTSSNNLNITGITSPPVGSCVAQADFTVNKRILCEGDSVLFVDGSWNADVNTRQWSFPGGTPSTSTDSAVWVTYSGSGSYSAFLTVTAAGGSTSFGRSDVIITLPSSGLNAVGYEEDFETPSVVANDFNLEYTDSNRTWDLTTNAGFSGTRSLYIRNYNKNRGEVESFFTPVYDFTGDNFSELTFKYAYARRNSNSGDQLRVYASNNCGATWIPRLILSAASLSTSPDVPFAQYVPDQGDWLEASVSLSPFNTQNDVIFKFEFTSDGGNNIYIDDIRMNSPLNLEELESEYNVFPNPVVNNKFNITNPEGRIIDKLTIFSIDGKVMLELEPQSAEKQLTIELPENIAKGMYFLQLDIENQRLTKRLQKI